VSESATLHWKCGSFSRTVLLLQDSQDVGRVNSGHQLANIGHQLANNGHQLATL